MKSKTMVASVEQYLCMKRALGYAMGSIEYVLMHFARFADGLGHQGPLTQELAIQWARFNVSRQITSARRIAVLRPFARYLAHLDPANEIPLSHLFGPTNRRLAPHIYSEEEIRDLLSAAAQLPPQTGLRPATFETFFGLIACAGLRTSEAVNLSRGDVDFRNNILTVRNTKFGKSRLIPLHSTTMEALRFYANLRDKKIPAALYEDFFLLDSGRRLNIRIAQYQFRRLCDQLCWKSRGGHAAPRIMDLRHSFICHCLLRWYQNGCDVNNEILSLSTYVGHVKVTDTYWYITGIPELMAIAAQCFRSLTKE